VLQSTARNALHLKLHLEAFDLSSPDASSASASSLGHAYGF